jgi:hypothetical protein
VDAYTGPVAPTHLAAAELEASLEHLRAAPSDVGRLDLIVRRPSVGEREVLESGELDLDEGLTGDTWNQRGSRRMPDGGPHPDMQLNLIGARTTRLLGGDDPAVRALAGDQLHLDLDLSEANLPPGTRLAIGGAVIEVTDQPHTGCAKFAARYGAEALRFVNIGDGKELRLRGINAKVVVPGPITQGDEVRKLPPA